MQILEIEVVEVRTGRSAGGVHPGSVRLGVGVVGVFLVGLGVLVIAVPEILAYALGGGLVLLGLGILTSGFVLRGPRGPLGSRRIDDDFEVVVEPVDDE